MGDILLTNKVHPNSALNVFLGGSSSIPYATEKVSRGLSSLLLSRVLANVPNFRNISK